MKNWWLVTLTLWMLSMKAMAQYDLYVSLLKDGTLEDAVDAITDADRYSVTSMKVNGPINGKDMMFIRDLCGVRDLETPTDGKLTVLDLTDAYVVASTDVYLSMYGVDYTSQDGHFGSGFLYNCSHLQELLLPVGIHSIDTLAMCNCASLRELMIPPEVTSIGYGAFYGCAGITYLSLPNRVTTVEDGAFQNMSALEELFVGHAVTTLDNAAILGDNQLQTIYLGTGFRQFSPVLFYHAPSLQAIHVADDNPYFSSSEGVLFSSSKDSLVVFPPASAMTEYVVPEGVAHISPYAFCMASQLRSVSFPASTAVIDTMAFYGCQSLAEVTFCEGLRIIRLGAFAGSLDNASSLQHLILPASLEMVEGGAFLFQTALLSVGGGSSHYDDDGEGCLYDATNTILCHVPRSLTELSIDQRVDSVAPYAFAGSASPLIYLGDHVRRIGDAAFFHAGSSQITLGKAIEHVGHRVVDGCRYLQRVCCFSAPDDMLLATDAFFDSEGTVSTQCQLLVLPGKTSQAMQKRGFCDQEGNSYFMSIAEIMGVDGIKADSQMNPIVAGKHYDWGGREVLPTQRSGHIVILPDGKTVKYMEK